MAGFYQMDGNLDQLLNEFYKILSAKHVGFIAQYMEYLNPRADRQKLVNFYHQAGYELMVKQQHNYPLAVKYLEYGLSLDPNNVVLLENVAEAYYLAGSKNRAVELSQRALGINPASPRARDILQKASQ